jgi:perosamine synthetase
MRSGLAGLDVEIVREAAHGDESAGSAMPALVRHRDWVRNGLDSAGIETEIYFRCLADFPISCDRSVPEAHRFSRDAVCLPIHPGLETEDVDFICEQLSKCLEYTHEASLCFQRLSATDRWMEDPIRQGFAISDVSGP